MVNKEDHAGLYPSRSELIRVAVREFLIKELEAAKEFERLSVSSPVETQAEISTEKTSEATIYKDIHF